MMIKNKYTGIILLVLTICLLGTTAYYNISRLDYQRVSAKIIEVGEEISTKTSNVNHYVILEYEYEGKVLKGRLYVASSEKYKVNDEMKVRINPDDPSEIIDNSFNKYVIPFLIVIGIFDIFYVRSKKGYQNTY